MYKKKLKLKCMLFASQKNPMSTTRKKKRRKFLPYMKKKTNKNIPVFFPEKKNEV